METTLLTAGLACIIAGLMGGGLKAWGLEIPVLTSKGRQAALGALGMLLVSAAAVPWLLAHPIRVPAETSVPGSKMPTGTDQRTAPAGQAPAQNAGNAPATQAHGGTDQGAAATSGSRSEPPQVDQPGSAAGGSGGQSTGDETRSSSAIRRRFQELLANPPSDDPCPGSDPVRLGEHRTAASIVEWLEAAGYNRNRKLGTVSVVADIVKGDTVTVRPGPDSCFAEDEYGIITITAGSVSAIRDNKGVALREYMLEPPPR